MTIFSSIRFVLSRTWKASKFYLLLYIFLQIILGILYASSVFFYSAIIDAANGAKTIFGIGIIGIIILRLIYEIFTNFIDKFREYVWNLLDIKQVIYNNQDFIKKLSTLDLPTFEDPTKNDLIWRTFNRFQMQFKWYIQYIAELIQRIVMFAIILSIFVAGSPIIALFVLITHLIPIIIRAKLGEYNFTIYRTDSDIRKKFEYLNQIICGRETLPEIKIFHAFDFFKLKLLALYRQFTDKQLRLFKKSWIMLSFVELLPILSIFVFLIYTANQLINHHISTGVFILLYINVFWFSTNLQQLVLTFGKIVSDSPFIQDAVNMFAIKSAIVFPVIHKNDKLEMAKKLQNPIIKFDNVSFTYPNTSKPVLKDVSFTIPHGQNIAIIGENGAGKTTLVKLLLRMYDPTEGKITINNIDLKNIPENLLLLLYSTLFQSFGKFYLTIRENMEMASSGQEHSDEEYTRVLKQSNAWNFIKDYPNTIDQQLGPQYKNGTDLSGGQWQQLAIARALIKKAPICILDEPTSAIDAKSEMEIFDRLNKETKDNTVIFISHRFSTIKDAERIIVLNKGKIIEDGNHDKLIKNKGLYQELYTIQAERYER
ncbi:MAG: ABC transporter ATP-binding protein [bacterium]|nr:ABC transporter ATP-binding protein [bacterium]